MTEECSALERILEQGRLTTWFQPIVACRQQGIYGYEALTRGPSDSMLHSPLNLFETATRCDRLAELDLLCRQTAIAAFGRLGLPGKLFLNVTPSTVIQSNFRRGETWRFLERCGVSPNRIVIELTEHVPIHDYEVMRLAVAHYRAMGFSIAIDDLGAGYAGLRHWSELKPDYVKIDGHFAQAIDQDPSKQAFVRSVLEMGRNLNCRVIAEGIETFEEYRSLWSMGLEYGQGYYFARPAANPPLSVEKVLPVSRPENAARHLRETVRSLVREVPGVAVDTPAHRVAERFKQDPRLSAIVVVEDQRPHSIVRRTELLALLSGNYGHSLYSRRPIGTLSSSDMLLAPEDLPLETLSQRITDSQELAGDETFVIVDADGRYLGQGTILDLLRRITELQVRNARHANPLTGLPGNVPISERIDALLREGVPFVAAYCDLDRFKAFNDCYGYARGDDLIVGLAGLIKNITETEVDFSGHIGGDDFMIVWRSKDWLSRTEHLLEEFDALAPWYYNQDHREAGGLMVTDRQGQLGFTPLVSLSVAALPIEPGQFDNPHEIATVLSELKAQAKLRPGSALFVDRRCRPSAGRAHDASSRCPRGAAQPSA